MTHAARRTIGTDVRGATAVEFALIAFPLLLFIFGITEFGRALWIRQGLQATAIAGARCVALVQPSCGTGGVYSASMSMSYVQTVAKGWMITLPTSAITLNTTATCANVTGFSQVTINYTFQTVVPVLIPALGTAAQLNAAACFPTQPS
jgi:Flp pilus assembly protein TadG